MRRLSLQKCRESVWSIRLLPPSCLTTTSFPLEKRTILFSLRHKSASTNPYNAQKRVGLELNRPLRNGDRQSSFANETVAEGTQRFTRVQTYSQKHKLEREQRLKDVEEAVALHPDGSTLSSTERKAFHELFQKLVKQRTDITASGTESARAPNGQELLNTTLAPELQRMAEFAAEEIMTAQKARGFAERSSQLDAATVKGVELNRRAREEQPGFESDLDACVQEVITAIMEASSAQHIWKVLDTRIFKPVKALGMDMEEKAKAQLQERLRKEKQTSRSKFAGNDPKQRLKDLDRRRATWTPEKRLLLKSLPRIVPVAVHRLNSRFPDSDLSLMLLPQLKTISRTAHLLALTPGLYEILLKISWTRTTNPYEIIKLLQEMDREGVALNHLVLAELTRIIEDADQLQSGGRGLAVQFITQGPSWDTNLRVLKDQWEPLIRMRITEAAIRDYQAREEEAEALRRNEADLHSRYAGAQAHDNKSV